MKLWELKIERVIWVRREEIKMILRFVVCEFGIMEVGLIGRKMV